MIDCDMQTSQVESHTQAAGPILPGDAGLTIYFKIKYQFGVSLFIKVHQSVPIYLMN